MRWSPEQKALEATIKGTLTSVLGHETVEFRRYARATSLDHGSVSMRIDGGSRDDSHEARQYVSDGKLEATQILQSAYQVAA